MDIQLSIRDEDIKAIILGEANKFQERFWIKKFNRENYYSLEGTVVEVESIDGKQTSTITFGKAGYLSVEGALESFSTSMNSALVSVLCERSPEFKKYYDENMAVIEGELKKVKSEMTETLLKQGYIKLDSINIALVSKVGKKSLAHSYDPVKYKHGQFLMPFDNKYAKRGRVINPGEVYWCDLNPALPSEICGIRPVVVLSVVDNYRVFIVPTSTKVENKTHSDLHVEIGEDEGMPEKCIICPEGARMIDHSRMYGLITTLDEETRKEVVKKFAGIIKGLDEIPEIDEKDEISTQEAFDTIMPTVKHEFEELEQAKIDYHFNGTTIAQKHDEVVVEKQSVVPEAVETIYSPSGSQAKAIKKRTPQGEPRVVFEFTEEELLEIAKKKIEIMKAHGSKVILNNPIVDTDRDFRSEGVVVSFNNRHSDPQRFIFETEMVIYPFWGHYFSGSRQQKYDSDLSQVIVDKMVEKYGEDYKIAFACNYVKYYNYGYYHLGKNLSDCCQNLQDNLARIGKRSPNVDELVTSGLPIFDYDALVDINANGEAE